MFPILENCGIHSNRLKISVGLWSDQYDHGHFKKRPIGPVFFNRTGHLVIDHSVTDHLVNDQMVILKKRRL